jgi:4-oxalomesaconate tautomerase
MSDGIRCMLMRGGTSKGAYFLADDLPADRAERDALLLRIMGSPDPAQIDGVGGGHPLTSKVAVVAPSADPSTDVDYLFLQVAVDEAVVSDRQNCGNLLAGVGPFAVERGLVPPPADRASVLIRMVNTGSVARAEFGAPGGRVEYAGDLAMNGVPGTAAPITLTFEGTAGSSTGALLPTGNLQDEVAGVAVTCVDNGMPSVLMRATDLGVAGTEDPAELEAKPGLAERLLEIRLAAAALMGLPADPSATVPKLVLLSPARDGGVISTRSFLPVRCHRAIGVLGAVTVGAGIRLPGTVGHDLATLPPADDRTDAGGRDAGTLRIEHPSGYLDVSVALDVTGPSPTATASAAMRTARKLFDGTVFPRSY